MNKNPVLHSAAWAALFLAATYVVAFALQGTLFNPGPGLSPAARFDFLLERQHAFQAWLLLYPLMGLALGPLILGLKARLEGQAPYWMALATPLGWIWCALLLTSGMVGLLGIEVAARLLARGPELRELALAVSLSTGVVQDALGGGNELVGGIWTLLLALAARPVWSRGLWTLSLLIAAAGVLSIWPPLADLVVVFGLGQMLWFVAVARWMVAAAANAPLPNAANAPP